MKNLFSSLTAFYKKHTEKVQGIYRKKGIRPGTDWKIIVITCALCIVCAMGIHIFIYFGVKNNSWWPMENSDTLYQVKIDKKLLGDALTRFRDQADKLQNLHASSTVVRVSDPSL
jgi:hypothetical protein